MKNLFFLFLVFAFLSMSVASTMHDSAFASMGDNTLQSLVSGDQGDQNTDMATAQCLQCTCCHGHIGHTYLNENSVFNLSLTSAKFQVREGKTYLSQLHYPPSKPPKA